MTTDCWSAILGRLLAAKVYGGRRRPRRCGGAEPRRRYCASTRHTMQLRESAIMSNQLIPPPGMEPPTPDRLTPGQCMSLWADLMDLGHQLVRAGLRREVGPDGDLQGAYRRWYAGE